VTHRLGDSRLPLRYWSKVQEAADGCWTWVASIGGGGYGTVKYDGKVRKAHRVGYEALVAPIPDGLDLDHLCRVRACVNPDHLEPVTRQENILRGTAPAARNATVASCPKGHEYDDVNTYVYVRKDGRVGRYCRACRASRALERRAAV